jgi:hypothetical protein
MLTIAQSLDASLNNMVWRREIRLTNAQIDNVAALVGKGGGSR